MYTLHTHTPNTHTLTLSHMYRVIGCLADYNEDNFYANHHNENVVTGIIIGGLCIVESVTCFKSLGNHKEQYTCYVAIHR